MPFDPSDGRPSWLTASMDQSQPRSPASSVRAGASQINASSPFPPSRDFDIFEWHPQFQSCVRYFLDIAQHSGPVQAVAAFVNIQLPFQRRQNPVFTSKPSGSPSSSQPGSSRASRDGPVPSPPIVSVPLNPYIRRLVATGFDVPAVLHGFFGDDWAAGIGHIHEVERRNYLFAAKSASWLEVKTQYDMGEEQTVPFLRPLQHTSEQEILKAEASWSEWLAMQDWMIGPRSPEVERSSQHGVKAEDGADEGEYTTRP